MPLPLPPSAPAARPVSAPPRRGRAWGACALLLGVALSGGCGDATAPPPSLDLDALFAPATAAEIERVRTEWALRAPEATDVRVDTTGTTGWGQGRAEVRVLSHGGGGARHVGAVVIPESAAGAAARTVPVLVYGHGGDDGVSVEELQVLAAAMGAGAHDVILVAPSFRSEALRWGGRPWVSGGEPSPWDGDVEDAIAFLDAALAQVPQADPERIAALGFSRGGAVAMLMAARDSRIRGVVEFFGPTDFFGPYVREVVEEALAGTPRPLPGLDWLFDAYIARLRDRTLSMADARLELVRRSAVLHAPLLPPLQLHHGVRDTVVDVSQAHAMTQAMAELGREPPLFEGWIYPQGEHHPVTLSGSGERALAFLRSLLHGGAPRGSRL